METLRDKIIVALDKATLEEAETLLKQLEGAASFYKIGLELFCAHGWAAVDLVRKHGGRIFLDLKLHDIPTTVERTVRAVCRHEIEMVNVHALGGSEMMRRAAEAAAGATGGKKPKLLGVTILTSHSPETLSEELGIGRALEKQVLALAGLSQKAGLDGVVCSPKELKALRAALGPEFCLVTPGIRPAGSGVQDQKRICTPAEALEAGTDFMVIGRPVTGAPDPRAAFEAIVTSLGVRD